ncbi:MAG: hypothetical protein HY461_01960 [Parcubacteria group bacterium]|nr:hypothetical protein [Parcubacteria group bacterium]
MADEIIPDKAAIPEQPAVTSAPKKKRVVKKRVVKPKPIVFSQTAEPRAKWSSSSSGRNGIILAIVVVVLALVAFANAQTKRVRQTAEETTTILRQQVEGEVGGLKERLQALSDELQQQKEARSSVKTSEFSDAQLGIRFAYPQSLGAASAQPVDPDAKKTGDEAMVITFSSNPDLWVLVVAKDYAGDKAFAYDGSTADLAATCAKPLDLAADGYCDLLTVAAKPTVVRTSAVKQDGKLVNVVQSVPMNLPAGSFGGLSINVSLGLPPVIGRDLFAATKEEDQQKALTDFYRALIKREGLSLVVQENLKAHQAIFSSFELTGALPPQAGS